MSAKIQYDAVVVGGGPAGVTALACMIDNGAKKIAWIDPKWSAGRVGSKYREVPSNTKISFFMKFVMDSPFLASLLKDSPAGNSYEVLKNMPQDEGCTLGYAADLILFLTERIRDTQKEVVTLISGTVTNMDFDEMDRWSVRYTGEGETQGDNLKATRAVLATGSAPLLPIESKTPLLDLDLALTPTLLKQHLKQNGIKTAAVVGSSHSAILALKNLVEVDDEIQVLHFYRSPLKFAEYKDGWILYDNTGLKGLAADWAKDSYSAINRIKKIKLSGDPIAETQTYATELLADTPVVYAIGFQRMSPPEITINGNKHNIKFDSLTGCFDVPGLYGCGIAYPEKVTDPAGNVEYAVGFFKFMKFVKRVVVQWV